MTALVDRLKKHVAKMRAGDITDSTVHRLLALLRELLEERKERDKYPLLTMFCDWTLHTGLDRSKAGSGVLDILDETWAWSQRVDEQIQGLLRDISPQKLREQMISLLTSEFIDPSILDDVASCRLIIDYLIRDLQGKPVARDAKQIEKTKAARLAKGYRFIADRFYFETNDKGENQFVLAKQIEPASGGQVNINFPWPLSTTL